MDKLEILKSAHITYDENNDVCMEFWNEDKKVTIYLEEQCVTLIKVWGTDMLNEMSDENVTNIKDVWEAFSWLGR